MKKLSIYIILFIFISCKDKKDSSPKETKINNLTLNEFTELFQGLWMPRNYLKKVSETKSIFLSQNEIPYISELRISKKSLLNDTLNIDSGINNHEGYGFKIWNSNQKRNCEFENNLANNFDIKHNFYYSTKPDTIITITHFSKNKNTQIKTQYERISLDFKNYQSGYNYIANKEILSGDFEVFDSKKNKLGDFTFNPETGKVEGFEYDFYFIVTDYIANPGYPSDHVILRHTDKDYNTQKYLSIIRENDTIKLYDSKEIDSDTIFEFELAKLNYYLIRKKSS